MATFAPRESSADGEEYGAYHVKCGKYVVLGGRRRSAHGKDVDSAGFVYSARPIRKGDVFQVKILEKTSFFKTTLVSIFLIC